MSYGKSENWITGSTTWEILGCVIIFALLNIVIIL